jgi:hypothetical protein
MAAKDGWTTTVVRMKGMGANLTDEQDSGLMTPLLDVISLA